MRLYLALGALLLQGQIKAPLDLEMQVRVIVGDAILRTDIGFVDYVRDKIITVETNLNLRLAEPEDGMSYRPMRLGDVLSAEVVNDPDNEAEVNRVVKICAVGIGRGVRVVLPKSPEFGVQFNEENLKKILKITEGIISLLECGKSLVREFLIMRLANEFGFPKTVTEFVKWSRELSVLGLGS